MRRGSLPWLLLLLLAGLSLGGPGSMLFPEQAQARKKKKKKSKAQLEKERRARMVLELLRKGKAAYEKGEYDSALKSYEEAYAQYPDPKLLYALGQTHEKLENYVKALAFYNRYVAQAEAKGDLVKALKEEKIPELEGKLPVKLKVTSTPSGANLYVETTDNLPIGTTPFDGEVPASTKKLVLTLEGYEKTEVEVELKPKEDNSVEATLEPRQLVDDGSADPADPDSGDGGGGNLATWGYVTTGLGVAVLGTAGVFTLLQNGATDEVNGYDKRGAGASRTELQELKDTANSRHTTALILYIGGGVITAAGVSMILADVLGGSSSQDDEGDEEFSWGLQLAPTAAGGGWLGVHGRF